MTIRRTFALLIPSLLVACSGSEPKPPAAPTSPTWTAPPMNGELPPNFTGRHVFSTVGAYGAQPETLIGYVFHAKSSPNGDCGAAAFSDLDLGTESLIDSAPSPQRQSKVIYESTVDDHLNNEAAYAGIITAGVGSDRKAEVVVTDHVVALVPVNKFNQEKLTKLRGEAAKRPSECLFLISGVTLSSISKRFFKKVGANGSVAGFGFSYKGDIYSQDGGFSEELTIGVSLVRVRADSVGALPAGTNGPEPSHRITLPASGVFKRWQQSSTP